MTMASPRPLHEIVRERTTLATEVARLNAAHLRLCQQAGGIEIELLGCRRRVDAVDASVADRDALAAAVTREAAIAAELGRCQAQLDDLGQRLDELDRELAQA